MKSSCEYFVLLLLMVTFQDQKNEVLNFRKAINKKLDMHHIRKKYYCLDKTNAKRCAVKILKINSSNPN